MLQKIKKALNPWLQNHPALLLWIKCLYFGRKKMEGIQLVAYAKGKSCFEQFIDLGVGKGLVEVEVIMTALNTGTERAFFHAYPNTPSQFPSYPSGSGVGRVIRTGSGVKGFKKGDIVAGGMPHATKAIMNASRLIKVKDRVPHENAAFLHLAIIAIQGIRMGEVSTGKKVVVIGQGIIGRLATLIARAIEADTIVVTNTKDKLIAFGENGIALSEPDGELLLNKLNAEVVIDATGNPNAIHQALHAVRPGGKVILLGSNRGITNKLNLYNGKDLNKSFSIVGAHIRNIDEMPAQIGRNYNGEAEFIQNLIVTEKLELSSMISEKIPAFKLSDYYNEQLESTNGCGILVNWVEKNLLPSLLAPTPKWHPTTNLSFQSELNIAIIGCGDSGKVHARAVLDSKAFNLYIVVDTNQVRAEKLGNEFQCKYETNLDKVLDDLNVHVILITTPHFIRRSIAIRAAEAGKHIIVDKPLATNMEDAIIMLNTAIQNNVLLRTFHQRIYEPTQQFAKQLFQQDAIGRVIGFSLEFLRDRPSSYWFNNSNGKKEISWRGKKDLSGGGFLIMNIIHEIDFLNYIADIEIEQVSAFCDTLFHPVNVEDSVAVILKTKNKAVGTISASSTARGMGSQSIRIWGENGQIQIEGNTIRFFSHKTLGKYAPNRWHQVELPNNIDTRVIFFKEFRKSLESGGKTDLRDRGYQTLSIITGIYNASDKNEVVEIQKN